jgi:hypothetical protein
MLNQPSSTNSFWTDAELDRYINEGVRVCFAEVTQNNEGQYLTVADLDLQAGVESVNLPSDCFEVRAAYRKLTDAYVVMPYNGDVTRGYQTQSTNSGDTYLPSYYFRENALILRDIPAANETGGVRLEYIAFPEVMVSGSNAMPAGISPVFKQVVEMYAISKAKMKESLVTGVDTSALAKANLNELFIQFRESIRNRTLYPKYTVPFNPEGF